MGEERERADGHSVHLRWSGTIIGQQQRDLHSQAPSSPSFTPELAYVPVSENIALDFGRFSS